MVVLARLNSNTAVSLRPSTARLRVRPPTGRTRVTAKHRQRVVDLYLTGRSALDVAEEMGLGKTTVLRILKEAAVLVRKQGRRLT